MSLKSFLIFTLSLIVNLSFGQDHKAFKGSREYLGDFRPVRRNVDYSEISGSPYASEKLIEGYVLFTGGDSLTYYLRYNIYADEMEYLEGEDLMIVQNSKDLEDIGINGNLYKYLDYSWLKNLKSGYLISVIDGPLSIYRKQRVKFQDAKPAKSSYETSRPPTFNKETDVLLYSQDGSIPDKVVFVNNIVDQVFPTHQVHLKEYIKKNKIKVKKEEGFIELVEYYNALILKKITNQ